MLDDFNLVDKRQVMRNTAPADEDGRWVDHFILTFNKQPDYVCLNVDKVIEGGYQDYERLMKEIWLYLQG